MLYPCSPLVSRSLNSEYGNKSFGEKREQYLNKRRIADRPESLKMDLIYGHERWGDHLAQTHHQDMLQALEEYYGEIHYDPASD